jgi:hypothetical protein
MGLSLSLPLPYANRICENVFASPRTGLRYSVYQDFAVAATGVVNCLPSRGPETDITQNRLLATTVSLTQQFLL